MTLDKIRWHKKDNALVAEFIFKDFKQAFAFMTLLAMYIEQANHHPIWTNTWNKVEIKLQTHDAGNKVTEKDIDLAKTIDKVYKMFNV